VAKKQLTLGEALRARRDQLDLSQAEIAEQLGTTQGNLSRWERDLTEPREPEVYRDLADFLEISLRDLAGLIAQSAYARALRELALLQVQSGDEGF